MRRPSLLLVLILAGCAGTPTLVSPPAATPSPALEVATPSPKPTASATPRPTIDPDDCEIAIDTANHMMNVLLNLADHIDENGLSDQIVDETTDLAEQAGESLAERTTDPTLRRWAELLADIDDSRLAHLTGDNEPFINALGAAAGYGEVLKAACRPS